MLCIIQTRMSSGRLPGKMLMNICGKSILERVIDRVSQSRKVTKIIVATSDQDDDDVIASFCIKKGVEYFRGDLNNVANRFFQVVMNEKEASFIRINGDSPLIDHEIIDLAIDYFNISNCDIVTNVFPRTFPKGQSVEVVLTRTFDKLINSGLDAEQKEHVTKKYYDSPDNYRMVCFTSGGSYNNINMCIDDSSDKLKLEKVIKKTGNKDLKWKDLCHYF
jgi:spore coat polysaccharide biosynthesis protein SpsF (cytidylyltransferase family)